MVRGTTDFAVTFYNVTEMAAEARRRKQLEQEANMLSNKRTDDELAAAVGLLLLRYQVGNSSAVLGSQNTPTDKPINFQQRSNLEINRKRKSFGRNISTPSVDSHKTSFNSISKLKTSNAQTTKSSLLTSCRNILKEFLSQNNSQ